MTNESDSSSCCSNSDFASDDLDILTISLVKNRVPKISGRKTAVSEARWNHVGRFAGMAEVVKVKGQLLRSTGIVRQGRIYLHIEEVGYLMQREALKLITGDSVMNIMDLYQVIATGEFGCSWNSYKVYLELKTLGYIVGRHNVLWSTSPAPPNSLRGESHLNQILPTRREAAASSCIDQHERICSQEESSCRDCAVEALPEHEKDVVCIEAAAKKTTASQDSAFTKNAVEVTFDENETTKELHSLASKFSDDFSVTDIRRDQKGSVNVSSNHSEESVSVREALEINPQQKVAKEGTDSGVHYELNQFKCRSEDSASSSSEIVELMFDVFSPNTQFKKTFPGTPEFSVCIQSDHPPKPVEIQALEAQNGRISVRIAAVDCGRVSFFQYNTVQLPCMP